jgi:pilus assembly protein Flp/PilA
MLTVYTNYLGTHLRAVLGDNKGVTALEYGLIAAAICVAIATVVTQLGTTIAAKFTAVNNAM